MYERERHVKEVTRAFALLRAEVSLRANMSLFDVNIHAENFFRDLFNLVFDWQLINLNCVTKNAAYIDLVDSSKRKAIQVTSQNGNSKIKASIKGFFSDAENEKLELKVLLIGESKKKYTSDFTDGGKFNFDSSEDIVDLNDLARIIGDKKPEELREIARFLVTQTAVLAPTTETKEVETIMLLVEFLSDDVNHVDLSRNNGDIDPEKKIYRRFGEHADFITQQYVGLLSIYFEILTTAKERAGLDGVRAEKISSYLRSRSDAVLNDKNNDPKKALEELTNYFEEKLTGNGWQCDRGAIEFYLLSELIACNVFPNPVFSPHVN